MRSLKNLLGYKLEVQWRNVANRFFWLKVDPWTQKREQSDAGSLAEWSPCFVRDKSLLNWSTSFDAEIGFKMILKNADN